MANRPPIVQQPGGPSPKSGPAGGTDTGSDSKRGQEQPGARGTSKNWMPLTTNLAGCPPGLEYLAIIDRIQIIQAIEIMEVLVGWEGQNHYAIINGVGQQIYHAFEESECCERQCCKQRRTFILHIVDNFNKEVMTIRRFYNCCAYGCACCTCCQEVVYVESPPGNLVGSVHQEWGCCHPRYYAKDASGAIIFNIEGPDCCMMSSCCDKCFEVHADGVKIGEIRKRWGGVLKEAFTKADAFGVSFPPTMPVLHKAVIVGAAFFIDFMHFEQDNNNGGVAAMAMI